MKRRNAGSARRRMCATVVAIEPPFFAADVTHCDSHNARTELFPRTFLLLPRHLRIDCLYCYASFPPYISTQISYSAQTHVRLPHSFHILAYFLDHLLLSLPLPSSSLLIIVPQVCCTAILAHTFYRLDQSFLSPNPNCIDQSWRLCRKFHCICPFT